MFFKHSFRPQGFSPRVFSPFLLFFFLLSGPNPPVFAQKALENFVASANPAATEAGLALLKAGGNAVDAAIAVQAVLNVVEPQSSGIGGGCFFLYFDATAKKVSAIDGREEAPRGIYPEIFLDKEKRPVPFYPDRITGGRAAGVPGCVKALHKAWGLYGSGKIPWAKLFEAAEKLAEEGFPVSKRLAEAIEKEKDRLKLFPASRAIFFRPDGTPLKRDEVLVQKDLAATLRLIAEKGTPVFYEGEIARDIISAVNSSPVNPGAMSPEDLKGYEAPLRKPLTVRYRGLEIYGMPPPSSGGITLFEALSLLEGFDLATMKREDAPFIHLFSEIQRIAFLDRNRYLGDGDFTDIPAGKILSKESLSAKKAEIIKSFAPSRSGLPPSATPDSPPPPSDREGNTTTSHISILDAQGNALAMTTTIEHIFGCGMVVPGRGFVLNNELTDFDPLPSLADNPEIPAPNRPEGERRPRRTSLDLPESLGGKRPLSSMTPSIVFKDGKPFISVGSPGGTQIIAIVLNVLVNLIDFKMDAADAMSAPRILNRGNGLELEQDFSKYPATVEALQKMGDLITMREPFGNAQLVMTADEEIPSLCGASDPRGEGKAEGA